MSRAVVASSFADAPDESSILFVGDPLTAPMEPRIVHVVRPEIADQDLAALLGALNSACPLVPPLSFDPPTDPSDAAHAQSAFTISRKLACAVDAMSFERLAGDSVLELLEVDRAYCLFYDWTDGSLWSESMLRGPGDDRRSTSGVAGWAARTGLASHVPRAGDDPRWVAAIDDPLGDPTAELLVQPVTGGDGQVHAVLIAARSPRPHPLGSHAHSQIRRFAALIAPLLEHLSTHLMAQQVAAVGNDSLFRREAVDSAEPQTWGDVVRVSPAWLGWSYWLLLVLLVGSGVFVSCASVSTYSTGPAVIRSLTRSVVTVSTSGVVTTVEVMPGDRVAKGTVIARLDDLVQRAEVTRLEREFEAQLRNHMLDPLDMTSESAVRSLRIELDRTRIALGERAIVAAETGTIADLRVRPGQNVAPGDIAASVVDGDGHLEVVALLPGEDRPQLAPGMRLRFEIAGYRHVYHALEIDSVSADVIAPSEARRVLGAEVAEGLGVGGSVTVVRAHIPGSDFTIDGQTFRYHDGMRGTAEVRLRSERVIFALIPGLRRL